MIRNIAKRRTCRIWLLDLARGFPPTTQFDGFDISTAQYPAHEHLPANVRLKVLDSVNGEPPEDLQGQYDVVHLRLFISVIEKDPLPLLLNSLKLLRKYRVHGGIFGTLIVPSRPRRLYTMGRVRPVQHDSCRSPRRACTKLGQAGKSPD